MKRKKVSLIALAVIITLGFCLGLSMLISNPWNAKRIGDIPCPVGYTRISANSYADFLRSLPLKKRGALVHLHDGKLARLQLLDG